MQAKQFGSKCSVPYCIISIDKLVLSSIWVIVSHISVKLARTPTRTIKDKEQEVLWGEEFIFEFELLLLLLVLTRH